MRSRGSAARSHEERIGLDLVICERSGPRTAAESVSAGGPGGRSAPANHHLTRSPTQEISSGVAVGGSGRRVAGGDDGVARVGVRSKS